MTSFTQGAPLPDVTVTTTRADAAPDYYTNYLKDLADIGTRATDVGVAALDPLQKTGYEAVKTAADAYKPGLTEAESSAKKAASGIDVDRITKLLDPYRTNVVDEMARLQQQNVQRSVLPSLRAGFVGSGGLGSQRYAGALGQTMAEMQANLTGQQYGALSKGYGEAMKAALEEAQLANEAAKTQLATSRAAQELGLTGAGALTKAGAAMQEYEQSKLDAELKNAVTAAGLLRGYQIPTTQTETRKGPLAGAYGLSPLQMATGLVGLFGSAAAGTAGDRIKSFWDRLITPTGDIDWGNWQSIVDEMGTAYEEQGGGGETGDPYNP